MSQSVEQLSQSLAAVLAASDYRQQHQLCHTKISGLKRLSGGANNETWALDWHCEDAVRPLILRRLTGEDDAQPDVSVTQLDLATEAQLLSLVHQYDVPVPEVIVTLQDHHGLGSGYLMSRIEGETIPKRILNDSQFDAIRDDLAYQCGRVLAQIHAVPLEHVPSQLCRLSQPERLHKIQALLDRFGNPSPVLQLALNWLRQHHQAAPQQTLVHGDFRNGNLMFTPQGLRCVLDWELAHIGNPLEDLGYICANVWRFGRIDKPVGGFGDYEQLLSGYASISGWQPKPSDLLYWEVYAALGWGTVSLTMLDMYRSGVDRSLERAAVGRRFSESEMDILLLLDGKL